ncbi:hypothetical protein MBANPS3_007270 [Mucor bainieri]
MSSRLFSFFSSKLSRQDSQMSLASSLTQEGEDESIMSVSSFVSSSTKNWHYCNCCKIGFASKHRHDWHLDLCRGRSSSPAYIKVGMDRL